MAIGFLRRKEVKKIFLVLLALGLIATLGWGAEAEFWTDVCPDPDIEYCEDVGKTAYDYRGMFKLGQIIGVMRRSGGPATAGDSDGDSIDPVYYYIIDDGTGSPSFIRQCDGITAK